jgi:hypothetical protein
MNSLGRNTDRPKNRPSGCCTKPWRRLRPPCVLPSRLRSSPGAPWWPMEPDGTPERSREPPQAPEARRGVLALPVVMGTAWREEDPGAEDTEVPAKTEATCRNVITMITHASDTSQLHIDTWVAPSAACAECSLPLDGYTHNHCVEEDHRRLQRQPRTATPLHPPTLLVRVSASLKTFVRRWGSSRSTPPVGDPHDRHL